MHVVYVLACLPDRGQEGMGGHWQIHPLGASQGVQRTTPQGLASSTGALVTLTFQICFDAYI